jgi:Rieske 2Fe-2S family protein
MKAARENDSIRELIASRRAGHGLPGEFYRDDLVYRADIERVWRRGWLFAGHTCQIREPGDYFTFEIDTDSLIVLRDDDGSIHALHNVCRHRGTLLCTESEGKLGRIVCPYHQWTYGRDGALQSCRGMHDDIDKSQLALHRAQVRELAGMIFVSLSDDPPSFDEAASQIDTLARPQGFERAKVAKIVDYDVAANWKLVWENNRECYHCNVNHPQYIKANFDHFNDDDTTPRVQTRIDAVTSRSEEKWALRGLSTTHKSTGMATFPDADCDLWFAANRTALVDGYVSESMDGRQVAPLMGDYEDADVGTLRIRTMPNFWNHSSCDHGVSTRLIPAGPSRTLVRVIWLVDEKAVEGVDYELEKVMPFWQLTSEQDWELCTRAQRGVSSSRYTPGPYSTHKEYNVDSFVRWYLAKLNVEP